MEMVLQKNVNDALRQRYFGMVIDNFTCNDATLNNTLATLMGEYLFYHIVDTTETATQLISVLNKAKLPGEVNFFALDIINSTDYDKHHTITYLSFVGKFRKMFEKICCDMPLKGSDIETQGFDAATLLPDVIECDGALIVMDIQSNSSNPMELYREQQHLHELSESTRYKMLENSFQMDSTMYDINETSKILAKQTATAQSIQHVQASLQQTNNLIQLCTSRIQAKQNEVHKSDAKVAELTETLNRLNEEIKLDWLLADEKQAIEQMQVTMMGKRMELQQINAELEKLQAKRENLSQFFEHSLMRRFSTLMEHSQVHLNNAAQLQNKEQELMELAEQRDNAEAQLVEIRRELTDLKANYEAQCIALRDIDRSKLDAHEKQKTLFDELEVMAIQQRNLATELNRLVAIKPYDATELHNPDLADMSETDINNQLCIARHQLQTFQTTNNFDLNILDNFKKDRENFLRRRAELTKIGDKIEMVMRKMDANVDASIKSSFDDLAKHFAVVFKRIVPHGSAQLRLVQATTASSSAERQGNIEPNGLTISARFDHCEQSFDNLPKQQKQIVSLAFIIALQRLCPAPFYLFDCIDQVRIKVTPKTY